MKGENQKSKKVKIGGGKKYKKCLGKKNGIDGFENVVIKNIQDVHIKCVKCMKHKPKNE